MRTILFIFIFLITQILSAQIYTQVDLVATFPNCDFFTDNQKRCDCNQEQFNLLSQSDTKVPLRITIDGVGIINNWYIIIPVDIDIMQEVDRIMDELRYRVRFSPATTGKYSVNSQLEILLPIYGSIKFD